MVLHLGCATLMLWLMKETRIGRLQPISGTRNVRQHRRKLSAPSFAVCDNPVAQPVVAILTKPTRSGIWLHSEYFGSLSFTLSFYGAGG